MFAMLSAAGSTLLMLHFLRRLWFCARDGGQERAPAALALPWLATAFAAIALPWALYSVITNASWFDVFAPKVLWDSAWPVLVGGLLAVMLWRWGDLLPSIPAGDVLAADKAAARVAQKVGAGMERIDWYLRRWPVAGVVFLLLTIVLAGTMFAGR
jgi:hypothetical protein